MSITQRSNRFRGTGRIISVRPSSGTPTTEFETYQIQSESLPASAIHAVTPILKPGTSTALDSNALFFEPTETYQDGSDAPVYSQLVVNETFSNPLLISQYTDEFPITRPGVMSTRVTSKSLNLNPSSLSNTASLTPRPISKPQTYRRKGTVQVFLTTSSTPDTEVAYSNQGVDWCSIDITNSYASTGAGSSATESTFKTFENYLVGSGATQTVTAGITGGAVAAFSSSQAFAEGATTYETNGIYRSEVKPFLRDTSGTQYYIKTNVSFATASVTSSATSNGTLTGLFNSVTYQQGYNEFTDGDDPVYTATPDTDRFVVSLKVNGVAQSISNPATAETHTFTDVSGSNSIEAEFGLKVDATVSSGTKKIRIGSTTITAASGTTSFYFTEGSQVFVEFLDASNNAVTSTSLTVDGASETNATTFTFEGIRTNHTIAIT